MRKQRSPLELARLRQSLTAKLNAKAKDRGVPADVIRKQYIFAVFLGRIFRDQSAQWVLLGGNALLVRTGGGRFTQDIDLARQNPWLSIEDARAELEQLAATPAHDDDPFVFELPSATLHRELDPNGYGAETGKVKARVLLGPWEFATFTIDLTIRRHLDGAFDMVPLRPVIDHATLQGLPSVPTTAVESHLADKICAIYERHGRDGHSVSTRYRDLADVVRIVKDLSFDAARLTTVLQREARRRQMDLPTALVSPGRLWPTEFPLAAAQFAEYPREYHPLDASLRFAGASLNAVLAGARTSGVWIPEVGWS